MESDRIVKGEKESYILFVVAGNTYGIHSSFVQQMEMIENITKVPNTPPYIEGVMFSRGKVIPVMNMRLRFGLEKTGYDMRTRVIVVKHIDRTIGLIVDTAKEYINLPAGSVQPAPEFIEGASTTWLEGITKTENRTILIFNVGRLLERDVIEVVS